MNVWRFGRAEAVAKGLALVAYLLGLGFSTLGYAAAMGCGASSLSLATGAAIAIAIVSLFAVATNPLAAFVAIAFLGIVFVAGSALPVQASPKRLASTTLVVLVLCAGLAVIITRTTSVGAADCFP